MQAENSEEGNQLNANAFACRCSEYEATIKNLVRTHGKEKAILNQKIEFMDYQLNDLKERYAHQKEVSDKMFSAINSNISHHENAKENYNDKCEVYKTQIQQFQNEIDRLEQKISELKSFCEEQQKDCKNAKLEANSLKEELTIVRKENDLKLKELEYNNSRTRQNLLKLTNENSLLKEQNNKIQDSLNLKMREQETAHLKQLEELISIQNMERGNLQSRIDILLLDLKRMSESAVMTESSAEKFYENDLKCHCKLNNNIMIELVSQQNGKADQHKLNSMESSSITNKEDLHSVIK